MSAQAKLRPATTATSHLTASDMRLLKWVGDPPVLKADGFSVGNWRYENARAIALHGKTSRIITPYDVLGKDQYGKEIRRPNGISKEYVWHKNNKTGYVLAVEDDDARVILGRCPHEFRDVTNVADPSKVRNEPIILKGVPAHPAHAMQGKSNIVAPNLVDKYLNRNPGV